MFRIISILIGYLIGCFQTAVIVGKTSQHIDIRDYGSGNAGATNAIRVLGWKAGIITFVGDLLKAIIAVRVSMAIWSEAPILAGMYAGVAVVIGHNWPVFLKFKGGKGIASTIGVLLAIDFRIGLILIGIMIVTIGLSRYVSLGSVLMALSVPFLLLHFIPDQLEVVFIGFFLMLSGLIRHQANIRRLLTGKESKLGHRTNKKMGRES